MENQNPTPPISDTPNPIPPVILSQSKDPAPPVSNPIKPAGKFSIKAISKILIFFLFSATFGYFLGRSNAGSTVSLKENITHKSSIISPTPIINNKKHQTQTEKPTSYGTIHYSLPEGWIQIVSYQHNSVANPIGFMMGDALLQLPDKIRVSSPLLTVNGKVEAATYALVGIDLENIQKINFEEFKKFLLTFPDNIVTDIKIGGRKALKIDYAAPGVITSYAIENGDSAIWSINIGTPDGIPVDLKQQESEIKKINTFINSISFPK